MTPTIMYGPGVSATRRMEPDEWQRHLDNLRRTAIVPPAPSLEQRLESLEALVRALTEQVEKLQRRQKRARRK